MGSQKIRKKRTQYNKNTRTSFIFCGAEFISLLQYTSFTSGFNTAKSLLNWVSNYRPSVSFPQLSITSPLKMKCQTPVAFYV